MKVCSYLTLLLMLFPLSSFGQEQSTTTAKPRQPAQTTSPGIDTVQVLDHARRLSTEARALKPTDEIRLQARLADAVWPFDRLLGERLLARSFELTVALLKESSDPALASSTADPQTIFAQLTSIASKHDTKFEKTLKDKWQQATTSIGENSIKSKPDPTQLSHLLLSQSANYLKTDEQKARQVFRQSVSIRVTQDHYFLLLSHRKRIPEITDTLFGDTLDVLARRPLSDANEILILSSYLFSPNGGVAYLAISGYNAANVAANLTAVPKNPGLAKRYLSLLLMKTSSSELIPSAVAYFALKNLVPQYQIHAPELLDEVYAKMANQLPGVSTEDSTAFTDAHSDFHASEVDATADWEKRIEKADTLEKEDWRDFEYFNIVFGYLLPKKAFTRATTLVSRIRNQELKEKAGDLVTLNALQARLETPETTSSVFESDCQKINAPLVRVVALSSLGQSRLKQKATGDALNLFNQAVRAANQIGDDQDRLQAKLMLVQLSLFVEPSRSFEWAAETFKDINKVSDFNFNRSNFSSRVVVYGLKNELPINSPAPSSLLSAVGTMCRVNCEETFQLFHLLEKKETRLWATFAAVRAGLMESSQKSNAALR
ncbi:MAG TPA: hypothetical protein VF290_16990 [Pyrinomonadaceae bacterium]